MPPRLILLPLMLLCWQTAWADVQVTAVFPTANSGSATPTTTVSAAFSAPVDPATVTPTSFSVFGLWSGVAKGDISLSADSLTLSFTPSRPFSAGERVTVSLARSVASTNGSSLEHGYAWHFMVGTLPATLSPTETTHISVRQRNEPWIQTYGAYAGDFDEDGYTDLAVPNERSNDFRLFLNDGAGLYSSFDTYPIPSGDRPSTNEGADFNMDGHIDFVVGNSTGTTVGLFMGDGAGALAAAGAFPVGAGVRGIAVLDLNGDNYPDVAAASRQGSSVSTLLNDGSGSFGPAFTFTTPGVGETAAVAADMNEDGIMDLVVGTYSSNEMVVLLGDGDDGLDLFDQFPAGGSVWMVASGDVNGDGHSDVVSANSDDATVSVLLGDGTGNLGSRRIYSSGVFTIAIDLGDLDGDGDLDMVASNFGNTGIGIGPGSWVVFENDGAGQFSHHTTFLAGGAGSCVVLHDRNNDGTLDITAIDELDDELVLFTNQPVAIAAEETGLPSSDPMLELFPNPMSHLTRVTYSLERPGHVRIELFDIIGRHVATLRDHEQPVGTHELIIDSASIRLPAGSYFIVASTVDWRRVAPLQKVR